MPTRTQDVLAAYAAHLRTERHASPHTIRGYLSDLRQFFAFAGTPGAVRPDAIRHWLRSLDGTAERTSIARKLAAVRGLFRFLADQKRLAADPTLGIATPKTLRKLPAHLTLDDVDRLLATPRGDTLAGLRGRALLEVLYSSGLRVSELVGLDWEQVDENAGLLRVLGKGRKERVVPVGRPALRALAAYRARAAEAGLAVAHGPVFLNARGGRLTARSVARLMEPTCSRAARPPRRRPTRSATPSRPTSSGRAPTCAPSRSCSATRASPPRSATRTSTSAG